MLNHQQWTVLDAFGAAPITEAFRVSEGIRTPRYDLYQQSVDGTPMYKVLDSQVKAAVALLKQSGSDQYALGNQDYFYNGGLPDGAGIFQGWLRKSGSDRHLCVKTGEKHHFPQ